MGIAVRQRFTLLAINTVFLCCLSWAGQPVPIQVGEQSPAPGSVLNRTPAELLTTYTTNIDPNSIQTSAFRLFRRGADGQFDTSDDVSISLGSPSFVALNQLRFDLTNATLPNDTYRFVADSRRIIANWKLDENTGTVAEDSTANNQDGTLINGTTWDTGISGSALRFVSDSYVEAPNLDGALGNEDFTVELNVKTSGTSENHLVGNRKSTTHANFWQVLVSATGRVIFEIDEDTTGQNYTFAVSAVAINDDAWHRVKAVRRGPRIEIYIDDVLSGFSQTARTLNMSNASSIVLGNTPFSGIGRNYSGLIDEVEIYRGVDVALRDALGLALDGEFTSTFPSGNGIPGGSFTSQFTINVQAPVAAPLAVTMDEDSLLNASVAATDANGDTLTYTVVSQPTNGSVQLNAATGSFTYLPQSNFFGSDSFTFRANDGASDSNVAQVSITINALNDPPQAVLTLSSGPFAVNSPVELSGADSSDIDNALTSFAWDFGDGTTVTKSFPGTVYQWSTPGVYTVTLIVTDAGGLQATAAKTVLVAAKGSGPELGIADTDGDGFSDEFETALGTNPASALSTPLNNTPLSEVRELGISKLSITLTAAQKSSSILLNGSLPVPEGFDPTEKTVVFDIGGVVKTFTLDAKGAASSKPDGLKLKILKRKGMVNAQSANFTLQLKGGAYVDALRSELAVGEIQKKTPRTLLTSAIFNGHYFEKAVTLSVTASTVRLTAK